MGAFNGSISYRVYFVDGDLPPDWKNKFLQRIENFAFTPLGAEDERDESLGWVPIERPLEDKFPLAHVIYNDFVCLGFRRDAYAISPELLKAELGEATRNFLETNATEKLTKMQKDGLKLAVSNALKKKALPNMKVTDMAWNLTSMELRFWSHSAKLCEHFEALFEETFNLKLIPSNPYINAMRSELSPEQIDALTELEPSNFVDASVGLV